ncbi:ROK family protein [Pseudooctadecabacter sp.]|uniref:ROK family protein n=1 Tax=Pseudooctadecabacter sp. TaxID=1966338 RepID=UPI0035C83273
MKAIGIDIGGTKIETQVFDNDWQVAARARMDTPHDYSALVAAVAGQVAWAKAEAGALPVGIGSAGLVHPSTGRMIAANLAANGHRFGADLDAAIGCGVTLLNDCRALALSEAVFGAGRGADTVAAVILGTGVSGGVIHGGALRDGPTGTGGEIGHVAAPAHLIAAYDLPIYDCGCGRRGCVETYICGPGLVRLAHHITGLDVTPRDIAARKADDMAQVWGVWCALVGEVLHGLVVTLDPDIIILGGGLSLIDGVAQDVQAAAQAAQFADFTVPPVVIAQGGDTSGARGAAYAAWSAHHD